MIFTRCIFKNCKLLGTSFCDSDINCMQIDNCVSTYCNFSGSKIKELYIDNSKLNETSFIETEFNKVSFNNVDFTKSDFLNTKLKDINFSTCNITNCNFDLYSIKGMIINRFQSDNIVELLGIKFDE